MKIAGVIIGILVIGLFLNANLTTPTQENIDPTPVSLSENMPTVSKTPTKVETFESPPFGAEQDFTTDFSIHSVSYSEILSGGPSKDGIPPIDHPVFIDIQEADSWLKPNEPIVQVVINQEAKAYPLQILIWHEIVNDVVGGIPVIVSFCPLCNTAIVYERTVGGEVFDFGTTGRLRYSNLIMYDRQTQTWWQQAEGKGIVGELTGTQLEFVPAAITSWKDFMIAYPEGSVLSLQTGFNRSYGQNPYVGYDDVNQTPFLYRGPLTPNQLPAVARVLAVDIDGDSIAYPYEELEKLNVINDKVGNEDIVIFWSPGTSSALDAQNISAGKDVGTAIAYNRLVDGTILTFNFDGKKIVDEQTGSTWNLQGQAIAGEFSGQQLTQIVSVNHFWFSWVAFKPETRIYQP